MGLSSTGIGSNLNVDSIVSQLMNVEKAPLTKLATKEATQQSKLSAFGTLKSALSQFQSAVKNLSDASKFSAMKASVGDSSVATVSATADAQSGNYSLKVTQLAQAQKLAANGVTSQTTAIGKGVISIDFGTISGGTYDATSGKYTGASFTSNGKGVKTITIDDTNNSLAGIRDAINAAGMGVTAKIVNDGGASPYRLTLTNDQTGLATSMKISVADSGGGTGLSSLLNHDPAGAQGLTQTQTAKNAEFTLDGVAISKPSNTVSDAIEGVTLNLLKVSESTSSGGTTTSASTNVSVARDTASVTAAINSFVTAYNAVTKNLSDAQAYDSKTKTAATLNGESVVRTAQTQIRSIMSAPVAGGASALRTLADAGVTVGKDGVMSVDSTKLNKALDKNFRDIAGLFATVGNASDPLSSYSTSSEKTQPGNYGINITQLATVGSTVGNAPASTVIDATNDTLDINLNGVSASITLARKTYGSVAELAQELQSKINSVKAFVDAGSSVEVTQTGGVLSVKSNLYGSNSQVQITGTGATALNFDASGPNVVAGVDVAGTINGAAATGSGQTLTSSEGDANGLAIKITGGATGARGSVTYSRGYASQFDALMTSLLDSKGPLSARTDGISATIKQIGKDRDALNVRLAATEARYRAQFSALDTALSKMSQTSSFLTQELAKLSSSS